MFSVQSLLKERHAHAGDCGIVRESIGNFCLKVEICFERKKMQISGKRQQATARKNLVRCLTSELIKKFKVKGMFNIC